MKTKLKYFVFILLLFFVVGCNDLVKLVINHPDEVIININDTYVVSPNLNKDLETIEFLYNSSDEEVFTVLENEIIPVSVGEAILTITLKSNEAIKKEVNIVIINDVEVTFEQDEYILLVNETNRVVVYEDNQMVFGALSFSSSAEEIAIVDIYGNVKALALGEAIISVEHKGKIATTTIIVEEEKTQSNTEIVVEGIKNLYIGDRALVKAIASNGEGSFTWENLTPSIIDFMSAGLIEGLMPGVGRVRVSLASNSDINLIFEIIVEAPVVNVEVFSTTTIDMYDNSHFLVITNHNNLPIKISDCDIFVADDSILAVSADGFITGKKAGKTNITVIYMTTETVVSIEILHVDQVNQRNRMVEIALTQYGYREGPNNDTKYGSWYGMPNQPWCAMFVSWVANELKIMGSIVPRYHSVQGGMDWFKGKNQFRTYKETQDGLYTPIAGDLLFLKSDGASHTAIVIKVVGDKLYTIEGNTSDQVLMRWYYYKSHSKITGYGIPKYEENGVAIKDFDISRATYAGGQSTT